MVLETEAHLNLIVSPFSLSLFHGLELLGRRLVNASRNKIIPLNESLLTFSAERIQHFESTEIFLN